MNIRKIQNFSTDFYISAKVSAFTAKHFWSKFSHYQDYAADMEKQAKGIDLAVIDKHSNFMLVDEKLKNSGTLNQF